MMRPINRIPLNGNSLSAIVEMESGNGEPDADEAMRELTSHSQNPDHLECTMDWAMQIRSELGLDWGTAIDIAMTLYFG